jgi:hypothetical protein
MKIYKTLLLPLFYLAASIDANAEWHVRYTFSKIEGKQIPLVGFNTSNEDKNIYLDIRLNAKNQVGLWLSGFSGKENIGYVFPKDESFYVPMRIRIGNKIASIKSSGLFLHPQDNEWKVKIALEREDNSEVMKMVLNSLDKNEEIAVEFSNVGRVYTFSGGLKKL